MKYLSVLLFVASFAACSGSQASLDATATADAGAACGAQTCAADELCCNVADPSGACAPYCVRGSVCPAVACRERCSCPTGQICCDEPTGSGTCAQQCVTGSVCPAVACTMPPPDAGADSAAIAIPDASGGCPVAACEVCGMPCPTPGLHCPNTFACYDDAGFFPTGADCAGTTHGVPTWICYAEGRNAN